MPRRAGVTGQAADSVSALLDHLRGLPYGMFRSRPGAGTWSETNQRSLASSHCTGILGGPQILAGKVTNGAVAGPFHAQVGRVLLRDSQALAQN